MQRIGDTHRAVIGGDDDARSTFGHQVQQVFQGAVLKPRQGQRTVRRLILGQLFQDLHLRAGMGQHVDEVVHDGRQLVAVRLVKLVHHLLACRQVGDFVVRRFAVEIHALQQRLEQLPFEFILAPLFVFPNPILRVNPRDLRWGKSLRRAHCAHTA